MEFVCLFFLEGFVRCVCVCVNVSAIYNLDVVSVSLGGKDYRCQFFVGGFVDVCTLHWHSGHLRYLFSGFLNPSLYDLDLLCMIHYSKSVSHRFVDFALVLFFIA